MYMYDNMAASHLSCGQGLNHKGHHGKKTYKKMTYRVIVESIGIYIIGRSTRVGGWARPGQARFPFSLFHLSLFLFSFGYQQVSEFACFFGYQTVNDFDYFKTVGAV